MDTMCCEGGVPTKYALITGSGRGLGKAIADQLVGKWRIIRHGKSARADDPSFLAFDLSIAGGAGRLWRETLKRTKGIVPDLVVLCAAAAHPDAGCLSADSEASMHCNFVSSCDLIRLCANAAVGRVICISSAAARLRSHPAGAYCTSKELLETYVKHAANEALPATIISVCRIDVLLDTDLCALLNKDDKQGERKDPRCALPLILALARHGPEAAGRVFCLSRALISLPDELRYCTDAIVLRRHCNFAEPSENADVLVVNGDNWLEKDGAYPKDEQARKCSDAMALSLNVDSARLLTVHGGITGALEAVCVALSVWDCDVIVHGQIFGGLEWVLRSRSVNFVQCTSASALKGLLSPHLRLVIVTQPSCYFCEDQSAFVREALLTLPSSVALVLDECYMPYARRPEMLSSLHHPRGKDPSPIVIGLRGMSKLHGLARLRLGFVVSDARTLSLVRACLPFKSMPSVTLREAEICLASEPAFSDERRRRYLVEKCHVGKRLRRAGITPRGSGPYIVVSLFQMGSDWNSASEHMRGYGVQLQPAVPDHLVYLLADRSWNNIFCRALVDLMGQKHRAQASMDSSVEGV